jgi:threonine/homoserine/homoserine lactone efflux protein
MSLQLWLAYVAAVFVISGTPGPNMLLSMTHGIHHGLARTLSTMLGLLTGLAVVLSISLGGLGAVLLASAYAFEVIKYAGAAYLIYLGIKTWQAADTELATEGRPDAAGAWARFRIGMLVSLSNPKAILFGVAFFPQFLDRSQPIAPQAVLLLATFVVIETSWMLVYAGGGAKVAAWLRQGERMRWFNRSAGGAFVGAGVLLGAFRR